MYVCKFPKETAGCYVYCIEFHLEPISYRYHGQGQSSPSDPPGRKFASGKKTNI